MIRSLQRKVGNFAVQRLVRGQRPPAPTRRSSAGTQPRQKRRKWVVSRPSHPAERLAEATAEAAMAGRAAKLPAGAAASPTSSAEAAKALRPPERADRIAAPGSPEAGRPLDAATREFMEARLGARLKEVRIHTGPGAAQAARRFGARAFTVGRDIAFAQGQFNPRHPAGRKLLAHELAHVLQPESKAAGAESVLWRTPAEDLINEYRNWGGLNLREEDLGAELVSRARAGEYNFVVEVIDALEFYNEDDVVRAMMGGFSVPELIRMARSPDAVAMLNRMREAVFDWWTGWNTQEELSMSDLLRAVTGDETARMLWNRAKIREIKEAAGSDLEALAQLFESDELVDDGSVSGRLTVVLEATEHLLIPGLQTGVDFADEGFAPQFRDPHPSSINQVGHFLTAAGLQFSPGVVSNPIPYFGAIRSMVQAPEGMSDSEVALRLTIGHEKGPDPNGTMAAVNILLRGLAEDLGPAPEGETEEQRNERVGRAVLDETQRQIDAIIAAFRTQFHAATDDDVAAWTEALCALESGDPAGAERALQRIRIDPQLRGNSREDLRLSLYGWRLGQMIQTDAFSSRAAVAAWIRTNLGPAAD